MRKYDFDPELEQLLGSMKDHQALGGDFDFQKSWEKVADTCGFDADTTGIQHTWRDWLEFYIYEFTHAIAKPLASGAVSVAILVLGFVGVANASISALPGEKLYTMKLGMEKVQLALATNDGQKAKLRLEFTNRRLEEMVELSASSQRKAVMEFPLAVDRLKQDVESLQTDLESGKATELAKALGRKADMYADTVASTKSDSEEVNQKVKEVKTILDETKEQAVDVMITAHEQSLTPESAKELQATFEKEFARVSLLAQNKFTKELSIAKKLQEQGLYRRSFQLLKEVEQKLTPQE